MGNLSDALYALGYTTEEQQIKLIQLYHACGVLTDGEIPQKILSDTDAKRFIQQDNPIRLQKDGNKPDASTFTSPSKALEWFNAIGQKQYKRFRPSGTERQQMTAPGALQTHSKEVVKLLKALGFLDEVIPSKPEVAALIILGAAQGGVTARFTAAAKMINEGKIKPGMIILASGARDLWPADSNNIMSGEACTLDILAQRIKATGKTSDNIHTILQQEFDEGFTGVNPKDGGAVGRARAQIVESISKKYGVGWPTEADMMADLAHKNDVVKNFPIHVVDAPKILVQRGKAWVWERPTTLSTLTGTICQHGQALMGKDVAVMSSQPHSKYQQGVVEAIMGPQYTIQMAAPENNGENIVEGLGGVFGSVFSSMHKAMGLLQEQEIQLYNTRWQEYIRERGRQSDREI